MTADMPRPAKPGKPAPPPAPAPEPERRLFRSTPIGALLPALTRAVFRRHTPGAAPLAADWPSIVGPAIAAQTAPKRLAAGTLTLSCTGPVALELQHMAGPLMERINAHLGRPLVQRLRFVQEAAGPRPRQPRVAPARARPLPTIDGIPDGPLRDALAALGARLPPDRA